MSLLPDAISSLAAVLGKLPGIGPRSAERIALHLAQLDPALVQDFATTLVTSRQLILTCSTCGGLAQADPCRICSDTRRDPSLLCLVEHATDVFSIEKSGAFEGKFHVLGGKISPLNGVDPEDLRIVQLEQRLDREPVKEVIIALSSDVEGDATSHYLAKRLAKWPVQVSRIAHGLPAGSGLEYADEITLSRALEGRRIM